MNEISGLQQTEYFGKENSKECVLNGDKQDNISVININQQWAISYSIY